MTENTQQTELIMEDGRSRSLKLWLQALMCVLLLMVLFYLLLFDLGESTRRVKATQKPLAVISHQDQRVLTKEAGTLLWKQPALGDALYHLDTVATLEHATARVQFVETGSAMIVEPKSLVLIESPPQNEPQSLVLQLVSGAFTRRKAGKATIVVKAGGQTLRLDDQEGDAVFRVRAPSGTADSRSSNQVELTVESGTLQVNGNRNLGPAERATVADDGALVVEPRDPLNPVLLDPPQLHKPKIHYRRRTTKTDGSQNHKAEHTTCWHHWFLACAAAQANAQTNTQTNTQTSGNTKTIEEAVIEFSWESVEGAQSYHVEISTEEDFKKVQHQAQIEGNRFVYSLPTASAKRIYFRAATVDSGGNQGPYSPVQVVEIAPTAVEPVTPPPAVPKPITAKINEPEKRKPVPSPKVTKKLSNIALNNNAHIRKSHRLSFSLGPSYHFRKFKNEGLLSELNASGATYYALTLSYTYHTKKEDIIGLRLDHLPQSLKIKSTSILPVSGPDVPQNILSLGFEHKLAHWHLGGHGLVATGHQLRLFARTVEAQSLLSLGAGVTLRKIRNTPKGFEAFMRIGYLVTGHSGLDALASGQWFPWGAGWGRHFYFELNTMGRLSTKENAYGAGARVGYEF
jgi:hypothetical protein